MKEMITGSAAVVISAKILEEGTIQVAEGITGVVAGITGAAEEEMVITEITTVILRKDINKRITLITNLKYQPGV